MRVKGTAYKSRLHLLQGKLGEAGVEEFMEAFRREHPDFPRTVLATTWIDAAQFLSLTDAIVEQVYGGDEQSFWEIGEQSALFTLRNGPYRNLLDSKDSERFAAMAKAMYANFFDVGEARSVYTPECVDLYIEGVPADLRHLYFEYSIVGYFRRGLELIEDAVRCECVEGFSKGDERVHYRMHLG